MIPLYGQSQIITGDEILCVMREGTNIPQNVTYIDGKPVKRNQITFDLVANVQPMNGRDLLLVPEGDRHKEAYFIFTNEMSKPLANNDQIKRTEPQTGSTKWFQVQQVQQWGSFQECIMIAVDVGPRSSP